MTENAEMKEAVLGDLIPRSVKINISFMGKTLFPLEV
jgi:hypothetical protein